DKLRASLGRTARVVPWREMPAAAADADIVVHATSVGLDGDDPVLGPYDLQKMKRCRAILDLVYRKGGTTLVRESRRLGIPSADGLSMLVHQAAAAYELFWEGPAPSEMMRAAVSA